MAFVTERLLDSSVPAQLRQRALDRAYADPGIPYTHGTTKSFWLNQPHPTIAKMQSPLLPSEADIVIIGSGITGTSVAKELLSSLSPNITTSERPSVVILDARDVCSGATGRNGGHILETADDFIDHEERFGLETAKKLFKFRMAHLRELLRVADELKISDECQAREVRFLSVYFEDEPWQDALERFQRLKDMLPNDTKDWVSYERNHIPPEFHLSRARGVISGPAGAIWPYKFVTGILAHLKELYGDAFRIESNTPVTKVIEQTPTDSSLARSYSVVTPRGAIKARHVVHCTNSHVGHLVPGFRGSIYPIRGQMSAQNPGSHFQNQSTMRSWLFNYDRGYDYVTQLPYGENSCGEVMIGGGFAQGRFGGVCEIGIATDDDIGMDAEIHLTGALSAVFRKESWGEDRGTRVKQMWTGNMGFSSDGLPWTGRLCPNMTEPVSPTGSDRHLATEWASVAFSGEGMVQAWLCGKALARMILQHDNIQSVAHLKDEFTLPDQMLIFEERLRNSRLPRTVQGQETQNGEPK